MRVGDQGRRDHHPNPKAPGANAEERGGSSSPSFFSALILDRNRSLGLELDSPDPVTAADSQELRADGCGVRVSAEQRGERRRLRLRRTKQPLPALPFGIRCSAGGHFDPPRAEPLRGQRERTRSSRLRPMYFKTSPGCRGLLCEVPAETLHSRPQPLPTAGGMGTASPAQSTRPQAAPGRRGQTPPGSDPEAARSGFAWGGGAEFSSPQKGRLPSRSLLNASRSAGDRPMGRILS